jgi:hypothetical protein
MSKVEIRVRPVVRHVLTRYTESGAPDGSKYSGVVTLGEFDNEAYAEQVAHAMRYMAAIEPPAKNLQHACHLEELSGEYGFNGYSSRFAIGDDVLYKQGTWRVDAVEFRDGKVMYHLMPPAGDEEVASSEDVYPTVDWQRKA